jgi:hypothetical protein
MSQITGASIGGDLSTLGIPIGVRCKPKRFALWPLGRGENMGVAGNMDPKHVLRRDPRMIMDRMDR